MDRIEPELRFSDTEEMLFQLAGEDLTKVEYLRKHIPKKTLLARSYLMQVKQLNELIEAVAHLSEMKR